MSNTPEAGAKLRYRVTGMSSCADTIQAAVAKLLGVEKATDHPDAFGDIHPLWPVP